MIVRPLQPTDAACYREIRRRALAEAPQFLGPLGEREATSELAELQARMAAYPGEGVHLFGSFVDEACVAVAGLNRSPNPKYAHKMFLWGMYVLPEHRGHSIGREILQELLAFARGHAGVRFVHLQVTSTNEPARALYLGHGFVCHGREPCALRLNDRDFDFELMQLSLENQGVSHPH